MNFLKWLRRDKTVRLDLRFVSYSEADRLIKSDPRWQVAKEEDNNRTIGHVWIELRSAIAAARGKG